MDVKPGLSPTVPAKVGNSLKDDIERGAAKSLAPLPTGRIDNITGTTEVLAESLSQYYSRHRGVFEFPHSSKDKGHKFAKSTPQKMADFRPKKGCILKTRLKLRICVDGGN